MTGVIIAADGPSAADVQTFTLRTDDGRTLDFKVGVLDLSDGGLPAPHLREHMLGGTETTVFFAVDGDGRNVAIRYTDAE